MPAATFHTAASSPLARWWNTKPAKVRVSVCPSVSLLWAAILKIPAVSILVERLNRCLAGMLTTIQVSRLLGLPSEHFLETGCRGWGVIPPGSQHSAKQCWWCKLKLNLVKAEQSTAAGPFSIQEAGKKGHWEHPEWEHPPQPHCRATALMEPPLRENNTHL